MGFHPQGTGDLFAYSGTERAVKSYLQNEAVDHSYHLPEFSAVDPVSKSQLFIRTRRTMRDMVRDDHGAQHDLSHDRNKTRDDKNVGTNG